MSRIHQSLFVILLFLVVRTNGQQLLGRQLASFQTTPVPLTTALDQLSALSSLRFSYQSDLFRNKQAPAIKTSNKTVQEVLYLLLGDAFEYTEEHGFIAIVKRHSYYLVSGHVRDKETGAALPGVQITATSGLFTTTSGTAGEYLLKIPHCYQVPYLTYKKELYQDAFVAVGQHGDQQTDIHLLPQAVQELSPVFTGGSTGPGDSNRIDVRLFGKRNRANSQFQASGLFNHSLANAYNFQFAGVVNLVEKSMKGFQLAGMFNRVRDTASGMQMATLVNKTNGLVTGLQLAAVNRAGKLKGVQIGIVNISDSSDGYSIGLLNMVRNKSGYHALSLYASDLMNANLAIKLGNAKLYTVIMAGTNLVPGQRVHSLGLGLGHDFVLSKAFRIALETSYQLINVGSWDNSLFQWKAAADIAISKKYRLFAGPVLNHYTNNQEYVADGYKDMKVAGYKQDRDWLGWQAGITATDWLWWRAKKPANVNPRWIMEAGMATGVSSGKHSWWSADLKAEKGVVGNSVTLMLAGFVNGRYNNSDSAALGSFYGLRAGLKIFALGKWFVAGELGYTLNTIHRENYRFNAPPEISDSRIMFVSPSVGWNLGRKTNLSLRYEGLQSLFLLRLGVRML